MTEAVPGSRKTLSTKIWAYWSAVISLMHGQKCIIFVRRSTNTVTAIYPSDGGKSVTRSMVICIHLQIGVECWGSVIKSEGTLCAIDRAMGTGARLALGLDRFTTSDTALELNCDHAS